MLYEYFCHWALLEHVAGILGFPSRIRTIVFPKWLEHVVWMSAVDYNIKPVMHIKLKYLF